MPSPRSTREPLGAPPPGPRYHEVQRAQLRRVAQVIDRVRPKIVGPAHAVGILILVLAGYPTARIALLACTAAISVVWQTVRPWIERRRGPDEGLVFRGLMMMTLVHGVQVAVTGGLTGPLVPLLFPIAIGGPVRFGRSRRGAALVALTCVEIVALAAMPEAWTGPPLPRGHHLALVLTSTVSALLLLHMNVVAFVDGFVRAGETIDEMRSSMLAEATERERALSAVSAKVAHELKNPLAAIKGLVQLLRSTAMDDRTKERFAVVEAEVARMETILRDYLSFSRPLTDLRPEPVELAIVVDGVLSVLEGRAAEARVELGRTGEATVVADPRRIKEALLNLIANAVEATPPGGQVSVSVDEDERGATVLIRDTGRGMGKDALARIGTPFFTTRNGGTGLGVTLARGVVVQHGGAVEYESEPGMGTTVVVRLPAQPVTRTS